MARAIAFIVLFFVLLLMTGWRYRGLKRLGITLGVGGISMDCCVEPGEEVFP